MHQVCLACVSCVLLLQPFAATRKAGVGSLGLGRTMADRRGCCVPRTSRPMHCHLGMFLGIAVSSSDCSGSGLVGGALAATLVWACGNCSHLLCTPPLFDRFAGTSVVDTSLTTPFQSWAAAPPSGELPAP